MREIFEVGDAAHQAAVADALDAEEAAHDRIIEVDDPAQPVVAEAMTLPLALKNAGRFEARLLEAIDPELARLPSAYGHDFASPPSLRHRLGEWSTRARPVWLRQRSYEIRRRLGPMADEHGGLLGDEWLGRVVDLDYPAMRRFFRIGNIRDSGLMRRIANLEYLARRLGGKLIG